MRKFAALAALSATLFVIAAAAAISLVAVTTTPAEAGPCRCPLIYGPVICDNGKTYPNPCVAECHHAKNCVPTGDL
jgi:hypothetical protein